MEKARAAALRAIELDDNLSQAHASLAFISYCYDWNWGIAEKEFKHALALNAANATAHQWYSEYLADLKRWDEAIVEARAALAMDPLSLIVNENLARPYYYSRQFDKAVELSQATLRLDPRFPVAHLRLGRAYAAKGLYSEAVAEFREFSELSGDTTLALASIANAQARNGHRSDSLHIIDGFKQTGSREHVPSYQFAIAYAGLGDTDQTIRWLEQAYEQRSDFLVTLGVEPMFDNLRSNPRFQDLLHRIALAP
jgi:tetratricopeptide (TPR) repeat protein